MMSILSRCHAKLGSWVGSSVVHLGDHNVPNALMFIDKVTSAQTSELSPSCPPAIYSTLQSAYCDMGPANCSCYWTCLECPLM